MKMIFASAIFIIASGLSHAGTLDFSLIQRNLANGTETHRVTEWEGVQLSYTPKKDTRYGFLSYEVANVCPKGCAFRYNMFGLGVGNKYQLSKNIKLFGQIGYYLIKNSWGAKKPQFNEAVYYYMNGRYYDSNGDLHYYWFDQYEVKNSNALGGEIGLEMLFPITKRFNTSFVFSYRMMKIKEKIVVYRAEWDKLLPKGQDWETDETKNYSSFNLGINFKYSF